MKINKNHEWIIRNLKERSKEDSLFLIKGVDRQLRSVDLNEQKRIANEIDGYLKAGIQDLSGYIHYLAARDFNEKL